MKRWDIFCKVVDNFGDIGVCWRLARQLQAEHGLQIRLWVDDLASAKKIIPSLNLHINQQLVDETTICHWVENTDFNQAAEVVIEAFACDLPPSYLASMSEKKSIWINLEYLSAEPWVDDFHAKPSPKPELKLTRHFYFPGFTEKTGGLIREFDAVAPNDSIQNRSHPSLPRDRMGLPQFTKPLKWQVKCERRESILDANSRWIPAKNPHLNPLPKGEEAIALSPSGRKLDRGLAGMTELMDSENTLKISLFCYPFAPIADLLNALQASNHVVIVYAPQSSILPNIAEFFGVKAVNVGDKLVKNNLNLEVLPFLSQADYDQLLRKSDLNFVRGEDSWIRAIWAGKPFIWQPYMQDENAHIKKLEAFLDLFYANLNANEMVCKAHRYWSAGHLNDDVLNAYLVDLTNIQTHTQQQAFKLANQPDLATKLVDFCNKL